VRRQQAKPFYEEGQRLDQIENQWKDKIMGWAIAIAAVAAIAGRWLRWLRWLAENHRLVFQFESLFFQFTDFTDFTHRRHRSNAEIWHNSWWTAALARKTGRTPGAFFGCDNVWHQDGFATTNTQQ
jgi:hypothetical protein